MITLNAYPLFSGSFSLLHWLTNLSTSNPKMSQIGPAIFPVCVRVKDLERQREFIDNKMMKGDIFVGAQNND